MLGLIWIQLFDTQMVFLKEFLEKADDKKKHEKFSRGKRVLIVHVVDPLDEQEIRNGYTRFIQASKIQGLLKTILQFSRTKSL